MSKFSVVTNLTPAQKMNVVGLETHYIRTQVPNTNSYLTEEEFDKEIELLNECNYAAIIDDEDAVLSAITHIVPLLDDGFFSPNRAELLTLATHPDYRGQGMGQALLDHTIHYYESDITVTSLGLFLVSPDADTTRSLLEGYGFVSHEESDVRMTFDYPLDASAQPLL